MSRGAQKLHFIPLLLIPLLLIPLRLPAQNGSSVNQIVTVEVKPITIIAVNGNPGALNIIDALGGTDELSVSDQNTRYSMVTNLDNMKIVASVNDPMPAGTRLMIRLESTSGESNGEVDISSARTPVNVVSGIGRGSDLNQTITYTFAADANVSEISAQSRVITLTLTE
ncbi:MAG: hypothetical protein FJ217_16230 [Ignavibacteria bacterium]|nr:hypothetical protein [Ignavibacteria bacterium]